MDLKSYSIYTTPHAHECEYKEDSLLNAFPHSCHWISEKFGCYILCSYTRVSEAQLLAFSGREAQLLAFSGRLQISSSLEAVSSSAGDG